MFDVTMESFDETKVCELVGLFLLYQMKLLLGCNCVGLYRNDGLTVLNNIFGPKTDRTRKQLIKLFQNYCMKISVELNLTQTDFLDTTLNLNTKKFWLYRKPKDSPLYISKNSNHHPSIKNKSHLWSMIGSPNSHHLRMSLIERAPMYNISYSRTRIRN